MMNTRVMESRGYIYKSVLGEGIYGKVVKARSTRLKKTVAIKIIDIKKVNSCYSEKFLPREMEIIRTLSHPNIVTTYDIFKLQSKTVYLVMELCVKGDLLKHINANGALPEHSSCRFFLQLCMAVQYLHNMNVAHRDLKCENLLLDTHYTLKVCDFGFSKTLTYRDGQMVLSETYCGTSSYAAPEILRGCPYDPKVSDVWSIGVVLYMMLSASMPYDASNIRRMVGIQMQHNINFPNTVSVSLEAMDLIRAILHPDVEQRITVSHMLQSSWMLQEGRAKKSAENTSTSNTGSGQERLHENAKEDEELSKNCSDPGEGPSTTGPR